ncbi:MAG: NAD-dependent epimerase/dehydratase family protein, partial [Deltaproteobacteria bacterium]|nr:NAD-dependent epimerase/dehydratase family protein [Deltaproteobacteria bacterium]
NRRLIEEKSAGVIIGSVSSQEVADDAAEGADVVFHLAAAQHEMNVPDKHFTDVNVEGTRNMLEASIKAGVKRFVHGSTIGVYGEMEGVIDEHTPTNPDNIYGKTKLEGERLVLSHKDRLSVVVIRIPETYGPGDRRLLKLFRGIDRKMFFMIGRGENLHHLIYVDDLIEAFLKAAASDEAPGEVFLVAGKDPVTTNEMVETIADTLGKKIPGFRAPLFMFMTAALIMEKTLRPLRIQPPLHRRRMDFFRKSFRYKLDKARDVLGFEGRTDFRDGTKET